LVEQARHAQDSADDARAFALYREAADAGSPEAAFAIGQMYRLGVGVAANPPLAAFWYGEAARAGYPPAEMNLGIMQLRGIGLEADPVAGLAMINRAATHGNQSARDLLDDIARAQETRAGAAAGAGSTSK
jgi:TPR repeat protein